MLKKFGKKAAREMILLLIFNRFIIPSISAPDSFNLCETAPSGNIRRGLVLIAKLINGIVKQSAFTESYLLPFNDFVKNNAHLIDNFLKMILTPTKKHAPLYSSSSDLPWKRLYFNPSNLSTMHSLNNLHWLLQELCDPLFVASVEDSASSIRSAVIWDQLVLVLDHLGPFDDPTLRHKHAVQKHQLHLKLSESNS